MRRYKSKEGEDKTKAGYQVHSITLSMGDDLPVTIPAGMPVSPAMWSKMVPKERITQPVRLCGRILDRRMLRRPIIMNLLRRPLWHPYTVEVCLDVTRFKLNKLVENGQLPWAWDLGTGSKRKELRILGHSVIERTMGPIAAIGATKNLGLREMVNLVLPQSRVVFRSTELQRIFHGGPDLIHALSASGELEAVKEKLSAKGVNASPSFTRRSVAKLLAKRRIA